MAQATIHNIGNPKPDPAAQAAETAARNLKFASAFRGMESDIADMMHMTRILELCFENCLAGSDIQTDKENGKRYLVIDTDGFEVVQFAGFKLSDQVKSLYQTYHNVFEII